MRLSRGSPLRKILLNALYVASIGLALHLVLPQIPGLERSARLVAEAAPLLIGAAFVSEALSVICYAELLGRSVGAASRAETSIRARNRAGVGPWFMLRLTVSGYGAAHVLPGGGAAAATVTYRALRARGFDPRQIGFALATVSALVYVVLGTAFAASLAYMFVNRDLSSIEAASTLAALLLTVAALAGSYAAYRSPLSVERIVGRVIFVTTRMLRRGYSRQEADDRAKRLVSNVRDSLRAVERRIRTSPAETLRWGALALGYWAFDALCLIIMFRALGVPVGTVELLVAYGVASSAGSLPLTPGGIGVFETTMLATLALLGAGSESVIPILGYRLFNFWMPIPLAVIFYPTLRIRAARSRSAG